MCIYVNLWCICLSVTQERIEINNVLIVSISIQIHHHHTESIKEPGRPPVLDLVEKHMVEYIVYRYDHGFGMQWQDVQQLARDAASALANARGVSPDLKQRVEGFEATEMWLKRFKDRHEDSLTTRRAQLFQAHRAAMCSESVVGAWVRLYQWVLEEVGRLSGGEGKVDNVTAEQIYNMDEAGLFSNPKAGGTVAAPTGRRECQVTGSEHGTHVSVLFVLCADGRSSEPFFILPGKQKVGKELEADGSLKGVVDGLAYAFAEKGNMTSEVCGDE